MRHHNCLYLRNAVAFRIWLERAELDNRAFYTCQRVDMGAYETGIFPNAAFLLGRNFSPFLVFLLQLWLSCKRRLNSNFYDSSDFLYLHWRTWRALCCPGYYYLLYQHYLCLCVSPPLYHTRQKAGSPASINRRCYPNACLLRPIYLPSI